MITIEYSQENRLWHARRRYTITNKGEEEFRYDHFLGKTRDEAAGRLYKHLDKLGIEYEKQYFLL